MNHNVIVLEGCDRSAKTTIANHYKGLGYDVIHFGPPDKKYSEPGYAGPSYLDDMVELFLTFSIRKVVLDRSPWGEAIWPKVYNRKPLLDNDDLQVLKEMLDSFGCWYILMYDADTAAHWQRCVDNKEPLTEVQFYKALSLYEAMGKQYGFEKKQLSDFNIVPPVVKVQPKLETTTAVTKKPSSKIGTNPAVAKLAKANAINDVLEKRIIKKVGTAYDDLEADIRSFLNNKLSIILGDGQESSFSKDEVMMLKLYCKRIAEKANLK